MNRPAPATPAKATHATVIPGLHDRDAPAAIAWRVSASGFEKHALHANPEGSTAHAAHAPHAQLSFGNGMVMPGSALTVETEWGRLIKQPDAIGGAETQSAYLVVTDADAVYATAKAAGAVIVLDIKDEDYGGRGFSCRDPEDHLWNFGSYDPW